MIRTKQPVTEVVIDLTGPEGNAFHMMAHAKNFARELGMDGSAILTEMMNGDYENLVQVFDKHFGHFCVLEILLCILLLVLIQHTLIIAGTYLPIL